MQPYDDRRAQICGDANIQMGFQMGRVSRQSHTNGADPNELPLRHEFEWKREECYMIRKPDPPVLVAVTKVSPGRLKTSSIQILDYNLNRYVPQIATITCVAAIHR